MLDEADNLLDMGFEPHIRSAQGLAIQTWFDANLHCITSSFLAMIDSVKVVW